MLFTMIARVILLIAFSNVSLSISIPDKSVVVENIGLVAEPESVIFHHNQVMYFSVGVRLSLILNPLEVGESKTGCNLAQDSKKQLWNKVSSSVQEYFEYLPKTFEKIGGHYCRDTDIDCMILEQNWGNRHFLDNDSDREDDDYVRDLDHLVNNSQIIFPSERQKRQAILTPIIVGGVTAAALGIYNYISDREVNNHLSTIDQHILNDNHKIFSMEKNQEQYVEKTHNLFLKMYHGMLNNEKHLLDLFCNATSATEIETAGLEYSTVLEQYKNAINQAMEGKVTDFLITTELLQKLISQKTELSGTIYKVDPGLFYLASTSMLTKVDIKHHTAYFLITTPIILEEDVSPLYRITNFGWIADHIVLHYKLPEFFYYLTDNLKHTKLVASPDLGKCQKKKGMFICNLKESTLSDETNCLQHILHANNTKGCKIVTRKMNPSCIYKILKGGVSIFGCEEITKGVSVRGMMTWKKTQLNPDQFYFFPYSRFESLSIGSMTITSKHTYMRIFKKTTFTVPEVNLQPYLHLMMPGIEHDLDDLQKYKQELSSNLFGQVSEVVQEKSYWIIWVSGCLSAISIIVIGCIGYHKLCKCNRKRDYSSNLFYLRDGRGVNL